MIRLVSWAGDRRAVEEGLALTVQWYLDNEAWWRPLQWRWCVLA